jgi:hypothetical protein
VTAGSVFADHLSGRSATFATGPHMQLHTAFLQYEVAGGTRQSGLRVLRSVQLALPTLRRLGRCGMCLRSFRSPFLGARACGSGLSGTDLRILSWFSPRAKRVYRYRVVARSHVT